MCGKVERPFPRHSNDVFHHHSPCWPGLALIPAGVSISAVQRRLVCVRVIRTCDWRPTTVRPELNGRAKQQTPQSNRKCRFRNWKPFFKLIWIFLFTYILRFSFSWSVQRHTVGCFWWIPTSSWHYRFLTDSFPKERKWGNENLLKKEKKNKKRPAIFSVHWCFFFFFILLCVGIERISPLDIVRRRDSSAGRRRSCGLPAASRFVTHTARLECVLLEWIPYKILSILYLFFHSFLHTFHCVRRESDLISSDMTNHGPSNTYCADIELERNVVDP